LNFNNYWITSLSVLDTPKVLSVRKYTPEERFSRFKETMVSSSDVVPLFTRTVFPLKDKPKFTDELQTVDMDEIADPAVGGSIQDPDDVNENLTSGRLLPKELLRLATPPTVVAETPKATPLAEEVLQLNLPVEGLPLPLLTAQSVNTSREPPV